MKRSKAPLTMQRLSPLPRRLCSNGARLHAAARGGRSSRALGGSDALLRSPDRFRRHANGFSRARVIRPMMNDETINGAPRSERRSRSSFDSTSLQPDAADCDRL